MGCAILIHSLRYEGQIYSGTPDSQLYSTVGFDLETSGRDRCAGRPILAAALVVLLLACGAGQVQPQVVDGASPSTVDLTVGGWHGSDTVNAARRQPRIALVLSGGGARGLAQVGVLRVLEEAGIHVDAVVGTSMGAVVGGLYCSGYSPRELDSIFCSTDWEWLLGLGDEMDRTSIPFERKAENDRSLLTVRFDGLRPVLPEAVSTGFRISRMLDQLVWRSSGPSYGSFDDLTIPFRGISTDLVTGKMVILSSGNLSVAIRASATVPLRFSPVRLDSMLLVDGGLLSNIPVDVARQLGCDLVVVVNTTSPLQPAEVLDEPLNVADQIVTLMMRRPGIEELARSDYVITPHLAEQSGWSFQDVGRMIDSGASAARAALDGLRALLDTCCRSGLLDTSGREPARATRSDMRPEDRSDWQVWSRIVGSPSGTRREMSRVRSSQHLYSVTIDSEVMLTDSGSVFVRGYIVSGLGHIDTSATEPLEKMLQGINLEMSDIYEALDSLVRNIRTAGYSFVRVMGATVGRDSLLYIVIDPGAIASISVTGLTRSDTVVVLREMGFGLGDPFEAAQADAAITRLLATGYFAQARLDVRPRGDVGVDLVVELTERSTSLLRLQACVDNERYTQMAVELAEENLLGIGTRASARFGGGLRDRVAEIAVGSNRIDATYWTVGVDLYGRSRDVNRFERVLNPVEGAISRSIIGEFRQYRVGVRAKAGRQVGSFGLVSVSGRFERQGTKGLTIDPDDPGWRGVATVTMNASIDSRDRYPFTRRGALLSVNYETSQALFGADASFVKFALEGELYLGTGPHAVRPRIRMGFADETLPPSEFFSLGGHGSLFGLREDELRGRQTFLSSIEYRYRLPMRVYFDAYASIRYDLGTTWLSSTQIRVGDLDHGIGLTLGLSTPVGPAEFSLGQSFTFNRPDRPSHYAIANFGPVVAYFSVGYRLD